MFQCEDCPYRLERAKLTWHDQEVLQLHTALSGRAVQDLHLTDLVFETARLKMSADEAALLVPMLEMIHEFANPPDADGGGTARDEGEPEPSAGVLLTGGRQRPPRRYEDNE